jgi:hypothetical protein
MTDLFGARWLETYGDEPSPTWANQIESLEEHQLKQGLSTVLKSGSPHPPSLPEFLAFCRRQLATPDTSFRPVVTDPAECMAGRWFLRHALQFRFCGIDAPYSRTTDDRPTLMEIRDRAVYACRMHLALTDEKDPEATERRIQRLLDDMLDELYPRESAVAWIASRQPIPEGYMRRL